MISNTNKVELLNVYGSDRTIAAAAWTSTSADVEQKTDEQVRDLIVNKLWNNGTGKPHRTPFERGIVEFLVTADVATHIHLIKHRHANINGESARYRELIDKAYIPPDWPDSNKVDLYDHINRSFVAYHDTLDELTPKLGRKRAKESARFFLPYATQVNLSVMMNMSCFQNFLTLRMDKAAQVEVRDVAIQMVGLVRRLKDRRFQYTLEAFGA